MTTDTKEQLDQLAQQFKAAFTGGPAPKGFAGSTAADSGPVGVAAQCLSAFQTAGTLLPAKIPEPQKAAMQPVTVDEQEAADPKFWGAMFSVVASLAPTVINLLTKDFKPEQPDFKTLADALPENRRNDPDFVNYTTQVMLSLAQGTVDAAAGTKDFSDPNSLPPIPTAPAGKDKGFWSDAWNFAQRGLQVALPIVLDILKK